MPELSNNDLGPKSWEEAYLILKSSLEDIYTRLARLEAQFGPKTPNPLAPQMRAGPGPIVRTGQPPTAKSKWDGPPSKGMLWRYQQMYPDEDPTGKTFKEVYEAINPKDESQ